MLFAVQVAGFNRVAPVDSGNKIESKIKARLGKVFRERGVFATLAHMEAQLFKALPLAQQEETRGNFYAAYDIVATHERLTLFQRIEAEIVRRLQAQGVPVSSSVPLTWADAPDRRVVEHEGQAVEPVAYRSVQVVSGSKLKL